MPAYEYDLLIEGLTEEFGQEPDHPRGNAFDEVPEDLRDLG